MITQARLHEILDYDPETGVFIWKIVRFGPRRPGEIAGHLRKDGYITIWHGRQWLAHRLAWLYVHGEMPEFMDHRDGDRSNNRLDNLRPATRSQNGANRPAYKNNPTGLKGVQRSGEKWHAYIRHNKRRNYLGTFSAPEEAHAAYVAAANKLHGEFARAQ